MDAEVGKGVIEMKFTPHITIWEVDIAQDDAVFYSYYFLTYKGAKKFIRKHLEEWKDYQVILGGEPLWFW